MSLRPSELGFRFAPIPQAASLSDAPGSCQNRPCLGRRGCSLASRRMREERAVGRGGGA